MPILIDPALQSLPCHVRRELELEQSYGPRGGHYSEMIMPLNAMLLARQRTIDDLKHRVAYLELALIVGSKAYYDAYGRLVFARYEPS